MTQNNEIYVMAEMQNLHFTYAAVRKPFLCQSSQALAYILSGIN